VDGVVEVRGGLVQGVRRESVWSFSGIPYAAPPTGSRRWRPPMAPEPWDGRRDCSLFGPVAPQTPNLVELSLGAEPTEQSEDCLSLNVWTPGLDDGRRPVMVWVHGGSFVTGSGAGALYRGGMLAAEGDVVVVTINYRLGMLGFLAHPALAEDGQSWLDGEKWTGFGNWGLADQIAALAWVRDHIGAFGGDPHNVTLFGESAGGMSVSALLAVPAARGLFHRAIVESGPPYVAEGDAAARRAEQLAALVGVTMTREALEQVPARELVRAANELGQVPANLAELPFVVMPVVDHGLLDQQPEVAVAAGSASGTPLVIGTTRDEFGFFTVGNTALNSLDEEGLVRLVTRYSQAGVHASELIAAVRAARKDRGESLTTREVGIAIATESVFRWPSIRLADAHASAAAPSTSTYCYLFTWESPAFGGLLGSCHALEIPFVFGTVHNPGVQGYAGAGEEAFALSAAMRSAWVEFARTGSVARWPGWEPTDRPTTVFGPWPDGPGMEHRVDAPRNQELEAVASLSVGH
jgi:para-nitrobenzyl esterase